MAAVTTLPGLPFHKVQPTATMPGSIPFDEEPSPIQDDSTELGSEGPIVMDPEPISQEGDSDAGENQEPHKMPVDMSVSESQEGGAMSSAPDSQGKTKRPAPPEALIIVHPSLKRQHHHPYNLQIQLLSRTRAGSNANSENGHTETRSRSNSGASLPRSVGLGRSGSVSSDNSGGSDASSAGSSSAPAQRAIPLYNLDYHHIRTTQILDAGTDQTVAKFSRKGVEIDNFGLLQPQEKVFHLPSRTHSSNLSGNNGSALGSSLADADEPRRSFESSATNDGVTERAFHNSPNEEPSKALRNKFMKRIRRFGGHFRGNTISDSHTGMTRSQSVRDPPRTNTMPGVEELRLNDSQETMHAPAISSPSHSSSIPHITPGAGVAHGKITMAYFWEIKRLERDEDTDLVSLVRSTPNVTLSRIWKQFNHHARAGHHIPHPPAHTINPRFEWVRDYDWPSSPVHDTQMSPTLGPVDYATGPRASPELMRRAATQTETRPRQVSLERSSTHHQLSELSASDVDFQYTSWTCFLVLDEATRIPLGQLTPAPHHPLIVCQLSLPNPLPNLSYSGLGMDGRGFSREELRDIVVVTSVHLVIRESLGSLHATPSPR